MHTSAAVSVLDGPDKGRRGHFTVCGAVGHSAVTLSFGRPVLKLSFVDDPDTVQRGVIGTAARTCWRQVRPAGRAAGLGSYGESGARVPGRRRPDRPVGRGNRPGPGRPAAARAPARRAVDR